MHNVYQSIEHNNKMNICKPPNLIPFLILLATCKFLPKCTPAYSLPSSFTPEVATILNFVVITLMLFRIVLSHVCAT